MSTKSAPPQPDYTGAANAQGAASLWNTQYQTGANRPDIYTPFGSMTWDRPGMTNPYGPNATNGSSQQAGGGGGGGSPFSFGGGGGGFGGGGGGGNGSLLPFNPLVNRMLDPANIFGDGGGGGGSQAAIPNFDQQPGTWGMHLNLPPELQAALESQQRTQAGRSRMAESLMGRVGGELGNAPDWSGIPGLVNGEDARRDAYDATYRQATSRLDPMWQTRQDQLETQLANQGILPGSPLYDKQMAAFNRDRNDAYSSALNNATQYGEQAASGAFGRSLTGHQQSITDLLQRRAQSFNELQALLGGAQVGTPQMPGFSQGGMAQAPNYLGAAQSGYGAALNAYNAQQMQQQGMMQGAGSLAMLAMML